MSGDVGRDELLVAALASGSSYSEAAKVARCSLSTVRRRMADSAFRERVMTERADYVDALRARLLAAAPSAVDALIDLLGTDGSVRLGAARTLLDHSLGRSRPAVEFDRISGSTVTRLVSSLVEAALMYMDEDVQTSFLDRAQSICRTV